MLTKLYLIRHGETEDAQPKRYKGHIDVPLSENGILQMKGLSKYIVQNCSSRLNCLNGLGGLNAVYCSDLSRAVKSAEIIAEPHGLKPIIMPELRERSFGTWEGMTFDEIKQKWPEAFHSWAENPLKFGPVQGESTLDVRDRAMGAFNRIMNDHGSNSLNGLSGLKDVSIAIVSHGGVNRVILCHILGIPLENIFRVEQDCGALNIIEFHDTYPVVKLLNFTL
ncbi:MAG: histidine phosphatase family protein [Nitrospirae bacterium]|nr:histidine phosphatase family protein [Nitrospirota bacterium]